MKETRIWRPIRTFFDHTMDPIFEGSIVGSGDDLVRIVACDDTDGIRVARLEEDACGIFHESTTTEVMVRESLHRTEERLSQIPNATGFMRVEDMQEVPTIVIEAHLRDFLADENEEFEAAPTDSAMVRETHAAVREWNDWNPTAPDAKRYKRFVESIEARLTSEDDERAFLRGEATQDNRHPS